MKRNIQPLIKKIINPGTNPYNISLLQSREAQKLRLHDQLNYALKANRRFLSFIIGESWRYHSMKKTLHTIQNPEWLQEVETQVNLNLLNWQKSQEVSPGRVEVLNEDWGVATQNATQKYGKIYTVLNMANAQYPGGGFLEGGSAQEENIWMRTTCANSLTNQGILYDDKEHCFYYDEPTSQLLRAEALMTDDERTYLSQKRKMTLSKAFKVFLNPDVQVCFRGREIFLQPESLAETGINKGQIAEGSLSFFSLPKKLLFPFYELRSAAPELTNLHINWQDKHFLERYTHKIRQGIAAQLDTLIINEIEHVALGAWGCGCFKNNPYIVAKIYREEIEKRADHFEHIIFPILHLDAAGEKNYLIFKEILHDLKIGSSNLTHKNSPQIKESSHTRHCFYANSSVADDRIDKDDFTSVNGCKIL